MTKSTPSSRRFFRIRERGVEPRAGRTGGGREPGARISGLPGFHRRGVRFDGVRAGDRLRQRRGLPAGAGTVLPGWARSCAHLRGAGRPQHQSELRRAARGGAARRRCSSTGPISAWPSTAMPTAPSSWPRSGKIVDGDARAADCGARPEGRRAPPGAGHGGGDGDVQPGPGKSAGARRHPHGAHAGGRQVRAGGDGAAGRGAGRRAIRPRHLPRVRHHRRRPADRAARAGNGAPRGRGAG